MTKKIPQYRGVKMNSCDIFQIEERSMKLYRDLENNNFSKFESDNFILKKYADAKFLGHYKYLVYDVNSPKKTIYKNLISLRKIIESVNKPLIELTEKDIMVFQIKLNQNKILCKDTKRPIAYSYKYDLVKNLRQFWNFYRMYSRYEKNEKIENITEFLMLRREYNVNKLIEFLTLNEIERLVLNARSLKMRTLIKVCFETGARPVEILNLRKFNCNFKDGKWIIKLPNMKGNSTEKMPIEIDYAYEEFNEWTTFDDENSGIPYNKTYAITYDERNNRYWIGTRRGLAVFDGNEEWFVYDENNGLTNDHIIELQFDNDNNL